MSSVGSIDLLNEIGVTATVTSAKTSTQLGWTSLIGYVRVSNEVGLTSLDTVIEHSADGVTWLTLATVPQITADGSAIIQIPNTTNVLPNVRSVNTLVLGTSLDLLVRLFYDGLRR